MACAQGTREAITLTVSSNTKTGTTETDDPVEAIVAEVLAEAHPLRAAAVVTDDAPTFAELGVHDKIVKALGEAGIERTFAIQKLTLPLALAGEDVIGQARTGTGKTLGFGVPALQRLELPGDGTPQVLVVVPTRELCLQVTADLKDAGKYLKARVLPVYGGRPYEPQIAALRKGVDVVIGTPGRLLDLAEQRHLVLGKVRTLVLDEADEMLDLGFLPDIERVLRMVPDKRQTMLFSATMPGPIITLARTFLSQPTHIRAEEVDASAVHERTTQFVYRAHSLDKVEVVSRVLQAEGRSLTMIFTRTKRTAQKLADDLAERGFAVAPVHGDLGQGAREQALRAFRSGKVDVLVCTDVAARGIDVEGVTHVVNYQCPEDEKTYVHRIGRTGRAGRTGVAVTLVDWDEEPRWKSISEALELGKPEPVETYSTSDHLFSDLGIPTDTSGRLPLGQRTREGLAAEELDEEPRRGRGAKRSEAKPKPKRERVRRRTRGGLAGDADDEENGDAKACTAEPPAATAEAGDETRPTTPRRRRRRTRAGGGNAEGGQAADGGQEPAAARAQEDGDSSATERPARRRRSRRRAGVETTGEQAVAASGEE
ncbi:DEAD/DEAH box helicase [Allokutzneria sp. A3M-2-11 16]|uniref:DEAD/DEAH box helicase n=1 Tax=Allokutzneria sp. A3M-2-11 16 TaxID=2962043 RepID=UPI0020B75030|nr:DEAD/DEAH box helicase [Allokutzneria sp. A3M-2-11 16]MCP3798562.1 DEAD/DEAH box helicase [Allokutzneria sp. A3M-2-11 16]